MKRNILFIALPVWVVLLFTGCEEKIDLDLDDIPPAIVIEGRISNGDIFNYVKISQSSPYLSQEANAPVLGAFVTLTEDGTITDTLTEDPAFPGYYYCPLLWDGKVGSSYRLTVVVNGETYTAEETILPVVPIDSLTYEYDDQSDDEKDGYYVWLHAQEPVGIGNNYQWLYKSNGEVLGYTDWLSNDEWVDGNYISLQMDMDEPQQLGDTVIVEMAAVSKPYFTFVTQLLNQENFGDPFDTPPANVVGNISNGAYGYWHAAGVDSDTIILR